MSLWDLLARRNDDHGLGHRPTTPRWGVLCQVPAGSCGAPLPTLLGKKDSSIDEELSKKFKQQVVKDTAIISLVTKQKEERIFRGLLNCIPFFFLRQSQPVELRNYLLASD
ncbi:unnamed protein product [Sphenostylis stenocarpa]|uniref:Uncharacterized protein n=1 Tax=Sphenostylis stenocarpa TaxID=92480 RepID=A0AA86VPB0_9FABA|nr:unnamed protein product [Sphenostylis stenocarpa]